MRLTLLLVAFLLSAVALALVASGGFAVSVFGVRVSAHSPMPIAVGATAALVLWLVAARRANATTSDLATVEGAIERRARAIVLAIAGIAGAAAVQFGSFSASGSDASGYLSQAEMLTRGAFDRTEPLAAIAAWPDGAATLAPLGWHAGSGGIQVPTYAVGLPMLMAIPHALGGAVAACLVVSVSAVLVVWLSARLAMLLGGGTASVLTAVWIATLPVEIYESLQPMSDVPVTAAWLASWWWIARPLGDGLSTVDGTESGRAIAVAVQSRVATVDGGPPLVAGLAAAVAVLVRPNLAPLAAIPLLYLFTSDGKSNWWRRVAAGLLFATPVALAGALVAYLQWRYFGSPLRSGYGSATEIYSLANLAPNTARYSRWLLETHGPWLLAAPLALLFPVRRALRWMLAFAVGICLAYLFYSQFEAWPYLRFLLPAMAIAAIAASFAVVAAARRLSVAFRVPLLAAVVLALATWQIASARDLAVFRFATRQSRAMLAGRYLESVVSPRGAVLITGEQSGAMRYYTQQSIVRWDFLSRDALGRVLERLQRTGREAWIVLDDWEAGEFRDKFRGVADAAGLDWPPLVDAGVEARTQGWRLRDRAPFLAGGRITTDRLR